MTVPTGAITNTAVSLVKAVNNPSLSNVLAVSTTASLATGNPNTTRIVTNSAGLVNSAANLLQNGSARNAQNTLNSAVKLAQGFLDPKTAGVVGSIAGGLNQIFGILGGPGGGGGGGNKPIALHTESLPKQDMKSAYAEQRDVVFSFVRMDGAFGVDDGGLDGVAAALSGQGALAQNTSLAIGGQLNSVTGSSDASTSGPGSLPGATLGATSPTATRFVPRKTASGVELVPQ